jgi:2-polyprenyl-3-methyl-5-hydroxy-6-metoxy-1,4-benzoquinol methylase
MPVNINCDHCGQNNTSMLYNLQKSHIVKCNGCGLIYVLPRLTRDERIKLYRDEYYKKEGLRISVSANPLDYPDPSPRLTDILRFKNPPGRLLEIGCSLGHFIRAAQDKGWESYGIDLSEPAVDYARKQLELTRVSCGEAEDFYFPDEYFDVIVLYHTLEHLESPSKTLQYLRKIIKPRGILVIEVPDIESYNARQSKEKWIGLSPQFHLYHFSYQTLKNMLFKTGFHVVSVNWKGGSGLLGYFTGTNRFSFIKARFLVLFLKYFRWVRNVFNFFRINLLNRHEVITIYARKFD